MCVCVCFQHPIAFAGNQLANKFIESMYSPRQGSAMPYFMSLLPPGRVCSGEAADGSVLTCFPRGLYRVSKNKFGRGIMTLRSVISGIDCLLGACARALPMHGYPFEKRSIFKSTSQVEVFSSRIFCAAK